jgi:hypothetical protein
MKVCELLQSSQQVFVCFAPVPFYYFSIMKNEKKERKEKKRKG